MAYLLQSLAYKRCFLLPHNPCSDNYVWYMVWIKMNIKEKGTLHKGTKSKEKLGKGGGKTEKDGCKAKRINYQQESELF